MHDRAKLAQRAERFSTANARKIPKPEKKVMAWDGGKVTSNKEKAMKKFLARKQLSQEKLAEMEERTRRLEKSTPAVAGKENQDTPASAQGVIKDTAGFKKQISKLRKKLKEIEVLEQLKASGTALNKPQLVKFGKRAEFMRKVKELQKKLDDS